MEANNYQGEDHERAVAQLFWDLYDDFNVVEPFDNVSLGIDGLYNTLRAYNKNTVSEVWNALISSIPPGSNIPDEMTRYGKVFAEHGMGVKGLNSSVLSWQLGNAIPTFTWDIPKTGAGKYYLFDTYYVEFYDNRGHRVLFSPSILSSSSTSGTQLTWTPTTLEWATITLNPGVIADGKISWVVRCSNDWPASVITHPAITTGYFWSDRIGEIKLP